jgi:hypothetical protein
MSKKLSPRMAEVLLAISIKPDGRGSAYGLRASMKTMDALAERGLVAPFSKSGWFYSPSTCDWLITQAGREVISKAQGGAQ